MSDTLGVADLAEETGLAPHIVRTRLRGLGVEKNDGKYQWSKKSDYAAVLKQLKAEAKAAPEGKSKGKKADDEKPSKKAKKVKENKDAGAAPENKKKKKKKSKE